MRAILRSIKLRTLLGGVLLTALAGGCPQPTDSAVESETTLPGEADGQPGAGPGAQPGPDPTPVPAPGPGPESSPDGVEGSLQRLGVDTSTTDRVDEQGEALPDDYAPLGGSADLAQTMELFVTGPRLLDPVPAGTPQALDSQAVLLELADDATGDVAAHFTEIIPSGTTWEADELAAHPSRGAFTSGAQSARQMIAADIDRDGIDELVVARIVAAADPNGFDDLLVQIRDDQQDSNVEPVERTVTSLKDLRHVSLVAVDLDGDGDEEVVVGLSHGDGATLLPLERDDAGVLRVMSEQPNALPQRIKSSELTLQLAGGNLDNDNGGELVVVVNEVASADAIRSRFWVFDDAWTGFAALTSEQPIEWMGDTEYRAVLADVTVGDIDADARDEVIFGGLTEFKTKSCPATEHLLLALDDAAEADAALEPLAGEVYEHHYVPTGVGCDEIAYLLQMRFLFINAFDVDGDGVDEIQANLRIFEDFVDAAPFSEIHTISDDELLDIPNGRRMGGVFSPATAQMVTGDFTGDGREDVATFVQWGRRVSVWGLNGPSLESASWERVLEIPVEAYNSQTRVFPLLVPCNVDSDGIAIKYSEADYRLVFTEPIILAALAAAPCQAGIDQNYDACQTAYGLAEQQSGGISGTVTVRASTWIGGETKFFGVGVSTRERITTQASFSAGRSYSLEEAVEYATGPMEDTVICTTLPVDQYTYTVAAHPDPNMVGRTIVINMPRTPVTMQVEREFYNQSVPDGAFKVGSNVFLHTPGDVSSYPDEADADALIDTGGLGHIGPLGELVDAAGAALGPIAERLLGRGLKSSRMQGVGVGGGESSIEIVFTESTDYAAGAEIDYELEVETTAGLVVGGSVGGSLGSSLSWGHASSTIYRGTVGDIAADDFTENSYQYGLFTYIYNYGNRSKPQFEVINYWVE